MTEANKACYIVTYYLDDDQELPCQEIMTLDAAAMMDQDKIVNIEELKQ